MILPYVLRLVVVSLGCFYLIHAAFAIGMNLLSPWMLAVAQRCNSTSAARLLLAARLFPSVAAILVVAGICVPSYLWLEPQSAVEQVGLGCLTAAFFGVVSWLIAAQRGVRAIVFSMRYARKCLVHGTPCVFALAGILRPRVLISRDVFRQLSHAELAAALRHERAHAASRDNLKRLLLLLAPRALPFRILRGLGALESAWMRFTEWSADDRAVAGDLRRAVSLAAALVQVTRMRATVQMSPLASSLVASAIDLESRVNRLLTTAPQPENSSQIRPAFLTAAAFLLGCVLLGITAAPTLQAAHQLLERLIR
jgi:Zn-dependent protease with chaperone function